MAEEKRKFGISSCVLHILAMAFMLSDHLWGSLCADQRWMTTIGRIAYPIFAFMIVEGVTHTSNLKKYMLRLFIFALIAEVPYDMLQTGGVFSIYHQNVLFTFLISILLILLIKKTEDLTIKLSENVSNKYAALAIHWVPYLLAAYVICYIGFLIGTFSCVDFFGGGIVTVLVFYIFREKKWYNMIILVFALYYINAEMISGLVYPVDIFGYNYEFPEQAVAVLALIPIFIYNGTQGYHAKWFKYFCYAFYPAHMLILSLLLKVMY